MRILPLKEFRKRSHSGYFHGLPTEVQYVAYRWLSKFIAKWRYDLPAWRLAILVGQAKRLALNPPTSAWGRSMHAKQGGLAVQRKYRIEGRHPTKLATEIRVARQRRKTAEARFRAQYEPYLNEVQDAEPGAMRIKHLDLF